MPQMMPINWILLFFIFILIFILFNVLNYFIFNNKINLNLKKKSINQNKLIWKW